MADSEIVKELKKERLSRHFDQVDDLTRLYSPELRAPPPFHVTEGEPWPAVYRPKLEQDSNANHMLRKHIRSRAFWKHHSDWEKELEAIRGLGETLLRDSLEELKGENNQIGLTLLFGRTALEDAFNGSVGMKVNDDYGSRNEGEVTHGAHLIAKATAQEDFQAGKTAHLNLVHKFKTSSQMKEIGSRWQAVESHSESMGKLLNDVLLAGDIVYPCRFCRIYFRD